MSTHKHFDKICCAVIAVMLLITVLLMNVGSTGITKASVVMGYEKKLFDTSSVHTINIIMDDWDDFTANCESEEYYNCTVVIDNEAYKNVAIRAKGNTSLTQVKAYGNNRYSFKLEFDHYDSTGTYYGLDKLCLNNIIQDNTYMKDYLVYRMMSEMGVASPLCSYVYISVNGEEWGLYLAVEGVEESFLQRNYGNSYGELYKPDTMDMGGGMGSGSDDVLLKYTDDEIDSYKNIFDNAKTDVSDSDKKRLINALKKLNSKEDIAEAVDVDSVIRYFVVHNFVLNFDSYTGSMIHNYYLYEKDGQMQMIPWDYNLAFGGFQSMGDAESLVNYPIDSPVSGGSVEDRPMLAWIFDNEEYTELYHKYFSEFISEYFDNGYFEDMVDNITQLISPYVESDPTKFCTYEEFEKGVSTLREFCLLRAESVSGQLNGDIGSDSETQEAGTLIDAGNISISDMGSMNKNDSDFSGQNPFDGQDNAAVEAGGMPFQMPDKDMDDKMPPGDGRPSGDDKSGRNAGPGGDDEPGRNAGPDGNDESGRNAGSDGNDESGRNAGPGGDDESGRNAGPDRNEDLNIENRPGEIKDTGTGKISMSDWILLAVSGVVLAAGIIFAKIY